MHWNFAWGEKAPVRSETTSPAREPLPEPPEPIPPRRLQLQPLEPRLAPNVAWGE